MEEKEKSVQECVKEKVEDKLKEIMDTDGVIKDNVDYIYKLVDIHKDIENEKYWKEKEENLMRYNGYSNYSEGGYGNYGRRGVRGSGRGRYRGGYSEGEDMLEEMKEHYGAYSESMGAYNRGNYGAGQDGMKALENVMGLFTEFTEKMMEEAESPEEKQVIKKYLKKISQMG